MRILGKDSRREWGEGWSRGGPALGCSAARRAGGHAGGMQSGLPVGGLAQQLQTKARHGTTEVRARTSQRPPFSPWLVRRRLQTLAVLLLEPKAVPAENGLVASTGSLEALLTLPCFFERVGMHQRRETVRQLSAALKESQAWR